MVWHTSQARRSSDRLDPQRTGQARLGVTARRSWLQQKYHSYPAALSADIIRGAGVPICGEDCNSARPSNVSSEHVRALQ